MSETGTHNSAEAEVPLSRADEVKDVSAPLNGVQSSFRPFRPPITMVLEVACSTFKRFYCHCINDGEIVGLAS